MIKLRVALFWNTLQSIGLIVVNFGSLLILARMLNPTDYGIYGILMVFISMSELVSDCGIGGYMIHKQNITEIYYDTLFVFNMSISIILYLVLYSTAPYIAKFYNNVNLILAIRILSVVIIVQAFSITQKTKLLKKLDFRAITLISLTASIIGFAIALILAYKGFSYWALIWQNISTCTITTIFYVIVNRTIPRFHFNLKIFKEQFSFGVHLFISSLLLTITSNISNNVIAKVFNVKTTGFYVQANRMQNYPISIVSMIIDRTFFPILSRQNNDINLMKRNVCKIRRLLYAYLMPFFTILLCFANEIIYLVLGERWIGCSQMFQILISASYFMLAKSMNRSVLKSLGETFCIMRMELYASITLIAMLLLAVLLKSINFLVFAFVVSQIVAAICSMIYLKWKANFSIQKQLEDFFTFIPIATIPCLILLLDLIFWGKVVLCISIFVILILLYKKNGIKEYNVLNVYRLLR